MGFQSLTLYETYVLCLRALISCSVAASVLVSAARLWTVSKFVFYSIKSWVWKHPEDQFEYHSLPEDLRKNHERFPNVAVQVWFVHWVSLCVTISASG
jgi:hypothetical protein